MPVALLYPNTYPVAVSNLGFQLIYSLLNGIPGIVCERFVYPAQGEAMRSLESGRALQDFSLVCGSVSFEEDFPRLVGMLAAGRVEPYSTDRSDLVRPGSPLVILGGVGVFMNPEPLAPFADIMAIGEGEGILPALMGLLRAGLGLSRRELLFKAAVELAGCYVPSLYQVEYDALGRVSRQEPTETRVPSRVRKVVAPAESSAAHSQLLSEEAELGMYMVELGRGCSRGCRFCAAGYIYRPPRLWNGQGIVEALAQRPPGVGRIGLLGMEMAPAATLDQIAAYLEEHHCSLSFSSLRADHISERLLSLLAASNLKSVAIAPDGSSERLRRLINKGLSSADLLSAAERLTEAGIFHLKLYIMIGLPTETDQDLEELVELVQLVHQRIRVIGRRRGRLTELSLSVNSFVPKPWTPFQYCSYGGLDNQAACSEQSATKATLALKQKIKYLRKALARVPNLRIKVDRPERILHQAVYSRGDRRLAPLLLELGTGRATFKQALKKYRLSSWQYAVRPRTAGERMCWDIVDHGLSTGYLWKEYEKALAEKFTSPCDTALCRRCGICGEDSQP